MDSSLILDIIVAVILVIGILSGVRKGFMRSVLTVVVYLIALTGAGILSDELTEPVYEDSVQPYIIDAIENRLELSSKDIRTRIDDFVKSIRKDDNEQQESITKEEMHALFVRDSEEESGFAENIFRYIADEIRNVLPDVVSKTITSLDDNNDRTQLIMKLAEGEFHDAACLIEEKAIRPTALRMIGYVLWYLSFFVLTAVGKIAVMLILKVRDIEPVRRADRILGGILGAVYSMFITVAFSVLTRILISFTGGFLIFTDEVIDKTMIFRIFYNFL